MLNEAQLVIRDTAVSLALEAGYTYPPGIGDPAHLRAPLGRFECQPYYLPYFFECVLNGDTEEPLCDSEGGIDADVVLIDDDERAAFGIEASLAIVWYSEQGFISIEPASAKRHDELRAEFDAESGA